MLRDRSHYSWFQEFNDNNIIYFWELLKKVIEDMETINTYGSKLPNYLKDLHEYAIISYEMQSQNNTGNLFPIMTIYRLFWVY